MPIRKVATAGLAVVSVAALAAVTACSSSTSSSSSAASSPASTAASSAASSASNPLSSGAASGTVVVGSANFPENELLAEVYALALQAKGVKVTTKLNIGSREAYYPQIQQGAITIIPEYNGNLLAKADPTSTAKTTADVDAALATGLPSTIEVLNPATAQDSDSITVTAATAAKYHLKTIADLKPYAASMVLGAPPEFKTRPYGIAGLKANYGLTFKQFDPLDEAGPITIAALNSGKVQAADVFSTDPSIIADKFVSLADPKSNFASQNVIPLVYKPAATSTITSTLNEVDSHLTTAALLQMDNAVITNKANYSTVAEGFLQSIGMG